MGRWGRLDRREPERLPVPPGYALLGAGRSRCCRRRPPPLSLQAWLLQAWLLRGHSRAWCAGCLREWCRECLLGCGRGWCEECLLAWFQVWLLGWRPACPRGWRRECRPACLQGCLQGCGRACRRDSDRVCRRAPSLGCRPCPPCRPPASGRHGRASVRPHRGRPQPLGPGWPPSPPSAAAPGWFCWSAAAAPSPRQHLPSPLPRLRLRRTLPPVARPRADQRRQAIGWRGATPRARATPGWHTAPLTVLRPERSSGRSATASLSPRPAITRM